ncbi:MAG: hypothetical protein J0L63_00155 [Anaerolineae bacterium]|nr:hypothetical protein [Anaerolineae bacterium]MBN8617281.1 hypothetical protein [Anaerolineae bacterium]
MSSLNVKRLIVWLVSFALGFVVTYLIVVVGFPILKPEAAGMTLEEYGFGYFIVTYVPIGLIFVTWIDAFMDTKILPD